MSYTVDQFLEDIQLPNSSLGMYTKVYFTKDNAALCGKCAAKNKELVIEAITEDDNSGGWQVVRVDANWENDSLHCDHCSSPIESEYGDGHCKSVDELASEDEVK
jgi:hypothetical protein